MQAHATGTEQSFGLITPTTAVSVTPGHRTGIRLANFLRLMLLVLAAATAIQVRAQTAVALTAGWNLLGNGTSSSLNVVTVFGSQSNVSTVWKWVSAKSGWAFYAPSMTSQVLTDYAASKGYDVLTTVDGGEGLWVNAKIDFTVQLPAGTAVQSVSFQNMPAGWNLIAIGDNKTPSQFNLQLSVTPPSPGVIPPNLTTLWAWDNLLTNWYFYAPNLAASGGLATYIASKGYLDFGSKVLGPSTGFWVNYPGSANGTTSATTTTTAAATTSTSAASTTTTTALPTTTTSTSTTSASTAAATTTTPPLTSTTTATTTTTTTATTGSGPSLSDVLAYAKAMSVGAWTTYARNCSNLPDPRIVAGYFLCPAGGLKGFEDFYYSGNKLGNPYAYVAKGNWSIASEPTTAGYASLLLNYTTEINLGGVYDKGPGTLGASAGSMIYDAANDKIVYYYNACWWFMQRVVDGSNKDVDDSYCGTAAPTNQCQADYDCGKCWYCDKSGSGNICRYGGEGPYGCYRGWSP